MAWDGPLPTPVSAKAIGNTSVAFRVRFDNGAEALVKPRSKRGGLRYRGEIAAYRLARALGLENVPPAYAVAVPARALEQAARAHSEASHTLYATEVIAERSSGEPVVRAALIPWRSKYTVLPLEESEWTGRWRSWLGSGPLPSEGDTSLAQQISNLLAFDFMTGNWDRFSGGNVAFDDGVLSFVDNDGAFFQTPPPAFQRARDALWATNRFSRRFVERVRALNRRKLSDAIGAEGGYGALISETALDGVWRRTVELLNHIDARSKALGAEHVVVFD
jgi:hypothetical protein